MSITKPKEKALEIYEMYNKLGKDFTRGVSMHEFSKECALKMVDLVILNYEFDMIQLPNENRMIDNINFWDKVKDELLKL